VCNTSGNIGGHFDPFQRGPTSADGYSDACGPDTLDGCEVGDLSGKLATINVAGKWASLCGGGVGGGWSWGWNLGDQG